MLLLQLHAENCADFDAVQSAFVRMPKVGSTAAIACLLLLQEPPACTKALSGAVTNRSAAIHACTPW
jgi:hypothetical protein